MTARCGCSRSRLRYSVSSLSVLKSVARISARAVRRIQSGIACCEAAPLVGGRRRERTERADRAVAWALRGGHGLDEEMIDVRPIANPAERTFDEHADAISLLRPSPCQGKSRQELVTILATSGAC